MHSYPYTLIAGDGLGVSYSSLNQIKDSILPTRALGQGKIKLFTNVANGNLVVFDHAIDVVEMNGLLSFGYIYNSQAAEPASTWRFSLNKRFKQLPSTTEPVGETAILVEPDGHETVYTRDPQNNYYLAQGCSDGIPAMYFDYQNQLWVWYDPKQHTTEYYDPKGRLLRRQDLQGRTTQFEYANSDQLCAVIGPSCERYEIRRQDKDVAIYVVISSSEILLQNHHFDALGRLASTQLPFGYKIDYVYAGDTTRLSSIRQMDGTKVTFSFKLVNKIHLLTDIACEENRISFRYDDFPTVSIDDYYGFTTVKLDESNRIASVSRQQGYEIPSLQEDTITYGYNDRGQLASITYPDNSQELMQYENYYGLLTEHTKPSGQKSHYYYCLTPHLDKLLCKVDYLDDKPLVTRYIYDRDFDKQDAMHWFLRFVISPEGRVIEYRPDNRGNIGSKREYLVSVFDTSYLQSDQAPLLQTMEKWASEQPQDKVSLIAYQYDQYGQVVHQRAYANVNVQGEGIEDDFMSDEIINKDRFGSLREHTIKQSKTSTATTRYKHDDLQRLLLNHNALGEETQYEYQDDQSQIKITLPNQRVELKHYNAFGLLDSQEQVVDCNDEKQVRKKEYERDTGGRILVNHQPDGSLTYTFYDRQNRLGYTVSTTGIVEEYQYDRTYRYQAKIHYAKPIDIAALRPYPELLPEAQTLQGLLEKIKDPSQDHYLYTFYDLLDRVQFEVDAENSLTEHRYNSLGKRIATIRYHTKLTGVQLEQLKQGQSIAISFEPKLDCCHRYFYDLDSQLIGEQDPAGYTIEYKRDAGARIIETIRYATPVLPNLEVQDFSKIKPSISPEDAHTYYFYDGRGQCNIEVDAEGFITDHRYLACGLNDQTVRFHTRVSPDWYKDTSIPPKVPLARENDKITGHTYDLLGREIGSRIIYDRDTATQYDNMGHIIYEHIQDQLDLPSIDPSKQRSRQVRFDGWEQVVAETNPFVAQQLYEIDQNPLLKPEEKREQKEQVWQKFSIRHSYSSDGLKLKTVHPIGTTTVYYYDQERRPIISIDASGAVEETTYNSLNQPQIIRSYFKIVPFEKLQTFTGGFITKDLREYIDELKDEKDLITSYLRNKRGQIKQQVDPEGYISTKDYDALGRCIEEAEPVDGKLPSLITKHEYDPRDLEIKTVQSAGNIVNTIEQSYDNIYGKKTSYIDENKAETKFSYDRLGRTFKVTNALKIVQQELHYDAFDRIEKEIDALGQTTEHRYNPVIRAHTLLYPIHGTEQTIIKTVFGQKSQVIDALGNKQTWSYAPDGQIAIYTDSLNNKTTNRYNTMGWLLEKEYPNGVVDKYAYNLQGKLILLTKDAKGLALKTAYWRDTFGFIYEVVDQKGIYTKQQRDKRGRLLQSLFDFSDEKHTGLSLLTQITYTAQNREKSIQKGDSTAPDQYYQIQTYDSLGRATGTVLDPVTEQRANALAITTQKRLDRVGRTIAIIDPNGNISRIFYNQLGQKRFHIDALGGVKEWLYNENGKKSCHRIYAEAIDLNQVTDQTDLETISQLAKPSKDDTLYYYFYNQNSRLCFTVNGLGAVVEKRYDTASRYIQTYEYSQPIDHNKLATLTTAQLIELVKGIADSSKDRISYRILDKKGQPRFTLDAKGAVLEQRFDRLGRVITEIQYVNAVNNPAEIARLPVDAVLANIKTDPKQDRATYHVFDSQGNPIYTVNPEGKVTRFTYNENGKLLSECQFANPINPPADYEELTAVLKKLQPNPAQDRITEYKRDNADRIIGIIYSGVNQESFELNALGNKKSHIDRNQGLWRYEYDRAQRILKEIAPAIQVTQVEQQESKLIYKQVNVAAEKSIEYDKNSNVLSIAEVANTQEKRIKQFKYNKNNQLQLTIIPNVQVDDPLKPASLIERPEKTTNILTLKIYNAKGLAVVSYAENNQPSFTLYDTNDQVLYKVNAEKAVVKSERNAFGEVVREIHYATTLNLDISPYTATGIPQEVLEAHLTTSPEDRITVYERDKRGDIELEQRGPVFFYLPQETGADYGNGYAKTQRKYNAFREMIYQAQLFNPKAEQWAETIYWLNRTGKTVAESSPLYYIKHYVRNSFDEVESRIEYAAALKQAPTLSMSLAELEKAIEVSSEDRQYEFRYDLLGRKLSESQRGVIIQELVQDEKQVPRLVDKSADIVKRYAYNGLNQVVAVTYADGGTAYSYYNALGYKIAEAEKPRDTLNEKNETISLIPLTYYGVNSFGQQVMSLHYKLGTAKAELNNIPQPIAPHPDDQSEFALYDIRGLDIYKQNSQGQLFVNTYTATGKLARNFYQLTLNLTIDETRRQFDALDREIGCEFRRNNVVNRITQTRYNNFGDKIAEDLGDNTWPIYYRYDVLGQCWSTNSNGLIPILNLYNLLGYKAVTLKAPLYDLSQQTYDKIAELLNPQHWDAMHLYRQEWVRDFQGRAKMAKLPALAKLADGNADLQSAQLYHFDAWNNIKSIQDGRANITLLAYNANNQLLAKTLPNVEVVLPDGTGQQQSPITRYGYDINGEKIGTVNANGHTQGELANQAGQVIKKVVADGATRFIQRWDALNRWIAKINSKGYQSRRLYDHLNRVCLEIDPLRGVKQTSYDVQGRVAKSRHYAKPQTLTITDASDLASIINQLQPDNDDTVTWFFYDVNGQQRYQINSLGAVQEKSYDNNGYVKQITSYAKTIVIDNLDTSTAEQIAQQISGIKDPANDRITFFVRDNKGRECFNIQTRTLTVNGTVYGMVAEQRFNQLNQAIITIHYANPVSNPEELAKLSPEQLAAHLTPDAVNDRWSVNIFNSWGQPFFTINPEGLVTRYDHDLNGNLVRTIHFAKRLVPTNCDYAQMMQQVMSWQYDAKIDRVETKEYDAANRCQGMQDALGYWDRFARDAEGNIRFHTNRRGFTWDYTYDALERKVTEVSPSVSWVKVTIRADGYLNHEDVGQRITKRTVYDSEDNAIAITEADGTIEARTIHVEYTALNKPKIEYQENVTVDDPSKSADFAHRPEKIVTISKTTVYNSKGLDIVTLDERGKPQFKIYDSANRLIYKIDAQGNIIGYTRNLFGNILKETRYANALTITLIDYIATGIPRSVIEQNLQPSDQDRTILISYNQAAKPLQIQHGPVPYYLPYEQGKPELAEYGLDYETIRYTYTVFNDIQLTQTLVSPKYQIWRQDWQWQDRCGNKLAEVNGLQAITFYERTVYGEEYKRVEYANPLPFVPTLNSSLAELQAAMRDRISALDRMITYGYDLRGNKTSRTYVQVAWQQVNLAQKNGLPTLVDVKGDATEIYLYNPTQQLSGIQYADGNRTYYYFDALEQKIAEASVPRLSYNDERQLITLIPLTYYGYNARGEHARTVRFKNSLTSVDSNVFPVPVVDANDQIELLFNDSRGLPLLKQDPESILTSYTYTETKRIARQYLAISHWMQRSPSQYDMVYNIDEHKFFYDTVDRPYLTQLLRNHQVIDTVQARYNAFGESIAEDYGNNTWPIYRDFDGLGRLINTNLEQGVGQVLLYDLAGQQTLKAQSATQDLTLVRTWDGIKYILGAWGIADLERSETVRDALGRVVIQSQPAYFNEQSQLVRPTNSFGYDRWDNRLSEIDALGKTTTYGFNYLNLQIWRLQPAVPVMGANNTINEAQPFTRWGYSIHGKKLGTIDANGHCEADIINAVGQSLIHILGDGTWESTRQWDTFGRVTIQWDGRAKPWRKEYNRKNQLLLQQSPSGKPWRYTYDQSGFRNSDTNPAGETYRYNQDPRGSVQDSFMPLGQITVRTYDRTRQLLIQYNPDGSSLIWKRDEHGVALQHTDLGGAIITYGYDFKRQLTRQTSQGGQRGESLFITKTIRKDVPVYRYNDETPVTKVDIPYYEAKHVPVGNQNLQFIYVAGIERERHDFTLGKLERYFHDAKRRRTGVQLFLNDGSLAHNSQAQYDALDNELFCTSNNFSMSHAYDAVGNCRHLGAVFGRLSQERWYGFDEANRLKWDQGKEYVYQGNLRVAERMSGKDIKSYGYDEDSNITSISDQGALSTFVCDLAGRLKHFNGPELTSDTTYNANGWQLIQQQSKTDGNSSSITNSNFTGMGYPQNQVAHYHIPDDNFDITDNLTAKYVGFDDWKLSLMGGYRTDSEGTSPYNSAVLFYDANGNLSGMENSEDLLKHISNMPRPRFARLNTFLTTGEGQVIEKTFLNTIIQEQANSIPGWKDTFDMIKNQYFISPSGRLMAAYSVISLEVDNWRELYKNYIKEHMIPTKVDFQLLYDKPHYSPLIRNPPQLLIRYDWIKPPYEFKASYVSADEILPKELVLAEDLLARSITNQNPAQAKNNLALAQANSLTTRTYVVAQGDTFDIISQKNYYDSSYAKNIADANGWDVTSMPDPGRILIIPPIMYFFNRASTARPYAEFLSIIVGSLYPSLETPLPKDDNFLPVFASIVVGAVLSFVLPGAFAAILPSIIGTSQMLITAVSIGLTNAATQGVCIALGLQHKFDFLSVVESAVTAGVSNGLGLNDVNVFANGLSHIDMQQMVEKMLKIGSINAMLQLEEMALGLRKKFDPQFLLNTVANQLSFDLQKAQLNEMPGFIQGGIGNVSQAVLSHAIQHTPLSGEQLISGFMGEGLAREVGSSLQGPVERIAKSFADYHKVSEASPADNRLALHGAIAGHDMPFYLDDLTPAKPVPPSRTQRSRSLTMFRAELAWQEDLAEIKQQAELNIDDIVELKPDRVQRSYSKYLAETDVNIGHTEQVKPKVSKWETFKSEIEAEPEIKQIEAVLAVNFGVANVLYETGKSLLHPIDNIVKPLGSLVWDTGLLAFSADYDHQAAQRMTIRWQGLKQGTREFYQDISSDDVWRSHYAMGELLGSGLTLFAGGEGVSVLGNSAKLINRLGFFRNATIEFKSLTTGGRQIESVSDWYKMARQAEQFYESLRSNPSNIDVKLISKNTGMPKFQIQRIKQHLFFNTHRLITGVERFAPDIEIADAWTRLQSGNFVKQDLQLLQHEYFESRFEGIFKTDYITAHNATISSGRIWKPEEFVIAPEMNRRS